MANKKRVFTAEEWDNMGLPSDCEGGEIIENKMIDHRRWSVWYEVTFRLHDQPDGEAYRVRYERGATECQEVEDPKEYKATVVRAVQKMVTVYEPVMDDSLS